VIVADTRAGLADALRDLRAGGESVALVPTMGFLHEGHLTLVDRAREQADAAVVSIFVNPLQFGPGEDLEEYPRDRERDLALLAERGAAVAFVPSVEEMYPDGEPRVTVSPGAMGRVLCGAHRPGHFRGVLTVVARLLGLVRPEVAVFGRKDFQQGVLVRRMVTDLELGVEVALAPVVREEDGLAMSSRNAYLGPEERADAPALHRALQAARETVAEGERDPARVLGGIRARIADAPSLELQYVEAVHPGTLEPVGALEPGTVVALAAFCGTTRLIDNVTLG
jgi:pantoate--beta-alanine ligase